MNHITLTVTPDRQLIASKSMAGYEGDHNFTHFHIERPKMLDGYICRAEIRVEGVNPPPYLLVEDDTFSLPSSLTKTGDLLLQLVFINVGTGVIAKTDWARTTIGNSINAVDEADPAFRDAIAQLAAIAYADMSYEDSQLIMRNMFGAEVGRVRIEGGGGGGEGTPGKSAYEIAVEEGFTGTVEEWLISLIGPPGEPGGVGKSAYELAVERGFVGTEEEWLLSIAGRDGADGYTIRFTRDTLLLPAGVSAAESNTVQIDITAYKGSTRVDVEIVDVSGAPDGMTVYHTSSPLVATLVAFISPALTTRAGSLDVTLLVDGVPFGRYIPWALALTGKTGTDGKSAYQTALDNGFVGTAEEWLVSLHGETGITPHIDPETGRWFLGAEDTGVKARGEDGGIGPPGPGLPPGGAVGQIPVKGSGADFDTKWVDHRLFYAGCSTAAIVVAKKTDAISGFALKVGVTVCVYFSNINTQTGPTLNVSDTGAKPMVNADGSAVDAADTSGIRWAFFVYTGAAWMLLNSATAHRNATDYTTYRMRNVALLPIAPDTLANGEIAMVYD